MVQFLDQQVFLDRTESETEVHKENSHKVSFGLIGKLKGVQTWSDNRQDDVQQEFL